MLTPLAVDSAQGHAPKVGAKAGQLGYVVSHLHQGGSKLGQLFIFSNREHVVVLVVLAATRLPSGQVLGVVVEVVDVGTEGLEVRDDKFLAEGLREQHDVALDAPRGREGCGGWGGTA